MLCKSSSKFRWRTNCIVFLALLSSQIYCRTEAAEGNYALTQPQILVQDGNIYFIPAENKNFILKTTGRGKVVFNNVELDHLVGSIQNSSRDLNAFKTILGGSSSGSGPGLSSRISSIEQTVQRLNQIESIDSRLTEIERRMAVANETESGGSTRGFNGKINRLKNRVQALENRLGDAGSGGQNPCYSNPCSNGGKCIPTMFGAFCYCPAGWEGERCDRDVNECGNFAGTELGCQNGATCVNQPGSYQCQCTNGYMGLHCTKRSGGCSSASTWELCGHGICVDQHGGSSPYTCICDVGWTHSGRSPACTVDVDECSQYHTTCSTNPPVSCINVPGSYVCGPCPAGYTGNGHQCMDVNECLMNNGGCSVNPMVQCTNTPGSRTCGTCPPGYMGTGMTCQYVGMCHMNNGGCHPLARCVDNPMIGSSFVQCVCPAGYTGTGMGLHGCIPVQSPGGSITGLIPTMPPSGSFCSPNPCQNGGACHSYGVTFSCSCPPGFVGQTCSTRANPCLSQPCQNGGTCQPSATGFTCSCPSDFTGDLCERQTESCGGYNNAEEGSLKYPQNQATYDHLTNCEWLMHTSPGLVFNLTFTNFHLEGGSRCSYDYLEIRDGSDTQSPLLGRFCGEELPNGGNLISTHNVIHLTFRSDHSVVGLGFEFTWNSTQPVCGGNIQNQTHGIIQSPGYPGRYPHDRDCTWQIQATLGKRLQLVFATFQIEQHPNCSYDYVEIRDGLEDSAPILEKLCNTTLPAPVTSSGPYLTVRFHSDDSSSDSGFLITFSEVPGVPGCGGLLSSATAVFSSPHHPQPYTHGLECDWLIRLPSADDKIRMSFITFELEMSYGSTCEYDYVEVHDGPSIDSPLMGRFCDNDMPPALTSSSNRLFVRFKSDESVALGGFSAKYEAVCGGEITSPDGILRSPYYPSNYPKLRDCVYIISQPVGTGINLQFLDFDIEPGTDTDCYFDYLEIRDGDNQNSTLIGHYCGPPQSAPEIITSSYNYLWVRFKTDGSVQNRGFMANFSTFETGCGGILRSASGSISSPGHPEVYPHGVRCMWVIRGNPGQIVRLSWDVFNLESSSNCRYDSVEIYDNSTSFINGSLVGKYCGTEHPPIITSSDTTLTVIFKSDHSDAYDGFMASYRLLNASTVCGGNYFTEYGLIMSPNYPNNYPNGKACTWVITAPRGRQIELNVTDFEMEDGTSSGCRYDYLEIRNGPFSASPLIGKFCGNRPPPSLIPSFANSLYVKFRSDGSHVRRGFKIIWDATSTGCGGVLNSPSGHISSPNYPSSYSAGMECVWKIQVNQGNAIQLTFVDVDLQHTTSSQCWGERVEVLDGTERGSPSLGKLCTEDHIISLQSTGNAVTIKFISSVYGGGGRGFQLSYRTVCNRVLKGFHGVIESPNFPNPYPHNRNCTWTIEGNRGNKLNISFSHFDVEGPYRGNCSYDFVQISEWKKYSYNPNKTVLGTYCGTNRPRLISSTKDTVSVTFVSDYSYASNGFRLEWRQYGCGGRIIGDYSMLKSPDYPMRYAHNMECVWMITTEVGTKVQLTVYDLDIERGGQECHFDGLEVYGGPDNRSPLLTKQCATVTTPQIFASHGNNMYIRFYSDGSVASKGFYGYINQVSGGCGGTFKGISGYIYTPNFPGNYDHNDDCSWFIRSDSNHVVELKFEQFDVERHINCSYDHVAVYDGPSESSPLLLMHCGNEMPDPAVIRSSGSVMLVRLKTDGSSAGKGFKAQYTQGCGARLQGGGSGVITTPHYPGIMVVDGQANCSWIIEGDQPDDRVTLTFTYMDMTSSICTENYVEVLDGDDFDAAPLWKGCGGGVPPTMTSRGNAIIVHIVGNNYYGHGFRAVYSFSSSACGGRLNSANGSISSPNYPNGYPANTECVWEIGASAGNQVQMTFRQFDVETSEFCNSDFVEIHEGSPSGTLLGHYCGNDIPSNVTAGEKLWIMLRTDAAGQAPGFLADFNLVHGVELSGSYGKIASPMYPQSYSGTGVFNWRVTVNETYGIQISFLVYQLDAYDSSECSYMDSITIYDGYDEDAAVLLTTCSRQTPDPVITSGNVVYIKYNRVGWYNSFLLEWQQVQGSLGYHSFLSNITGCGGNFSVVENNATTLTSPGFPFSYAKGLNCEWSFDAPENSRIALKVETLSMENYHPCLYGMVELYDGVRGLPTYQLNKTICMVGEQNSTYISSGRFLRVVFKTDRLVTWGTGFNFTLTTECGGYVRGSRGTISSINYPNNYVNSDCIWKVVVRPGRTIRIRFNSIFEIYSGTGTCLTDKLILRNGASDESPFLGSGRYCGSTAPATLETSGNHLYVHFVSRTHGGKGFSFTYEEVSLGCGGDIQLTNSAPNTNIESPNFPQIPPPYTECEWLFHAPQGEAVQINFIVSFDITYTWGCEKAGVEVRDGGTGIAPELGTFCQDHMPGTLKSTGNVLYLRYYTDVPEPRNGFKAEVKIATCGGVHTGNYGTISSPGYPAAYDVNLDCLWTIKVSRGFYIVLEFITFNLGVSGTNCTRDKINITEPSDLDVIEPRNWTLCGQSDGLIPNRIQSGSNELQLRFISDGQREREQTGMGFKARYRVRQQDCGGSMRTPTGYITSPGYPQPYFHHAYCVWRIYAPEGRRIRLEFIDFQLEDRVTASYGRGCHWDALWVYQGIHGEFRGMLYNSSLCGSTLPPIVESTGSEIYLYFRTDGSVAHRGFKIHYTTDLPILCGGPLEGNEGVISSPNGTTGTPNTTLNIFCDWKSPNEGVSWPRMRLAGNGTTIATIHNLQIPGSGVSNPPLCSVGFLRVAPANRMIKYRYKKLCGTVTNQKIYIPGNSLWVEYRSADTNGTFNMSYRNVPCGGPIHEEENVTSLNYPSAYPINTECIWMVDFPYGSQVKVIFYDMDLEDHQGTDGCDKDYVIIRNGRYPNSPQLGKYCGTYLPSDITSMSNELWIEFHSDGAADGSRRGFKLALEEVQKGCGGVLHRKYGQFASPTVESSQSSTGSPSRSTLTRYPSNTECEWIIESVPGYTVNVVFYGRFDIENSTNCTNDYVEVFQKDSLNWVPINRFCGRQLPSSINTTSSTVKVVFKTNENLDGDGFSLYWYSPCGGKFSESSGIIRSAHYDSYNHSQNAGRFWGYQGWESIYNIYQCDYIIQGAPDDYILIRFLDPFQVEVPTHYAVSNTELNVACPNVNVTMWQGNATVVERSSGIFCGTTLPAPFVSRGAAVISYNYRPYYQTYGFRAEYARFECGGEITTERRLRSPGHPFTSTAFMNCTWVVRAPPNKVVRFKFLALEVEYQQVCYWDSVRLYDGPLIDNTKKIGTYCGNLTDDLATISSRSNSMTIYFSTDSIIHWAGFEGAVEFTVGEAQGCGGTKNLTAGPVTLSSVDTNGDGKYDDGLDCQWLLIVPEFKSVEVTFSQFNLEDSQGGNKNSTGASCPFDFLEIRDGPGPYGQLLARLCGSTVPSMIVSSLNFMWIRFVTDGSINYSGFTFTARDRTTPCGDLVYTATDTMQYLQSPGYPSNYDDNIRCRWRIDGERYHQEVDITFIDMDIESSPDCQKDRMEIRDVSTTYTTPEGITGPALFVGNGILDWKFHNLNLTMDSILQDYKYCGSQTPSDFISVARSIDVVFHSDGSTSKKGVKIGYKVAGCNRTYENLQGRIFSPEWPTHTPIFSNCLASIRAPNGSLISLYFNSFSLPSVSGQTGCTEAALQIRDGSPTGQLLAQYCGTAIPDPVFSVSNLLFIKFFSRMHPTRGYDITYTTTDMGRGCGGNVFHTGGSISSPMYPGNYSEDKDCVWRLRVPGGLRVQLQFTNFMFGGNCQTDFLEISSLDSHDSAAAPVLFSRYCPGDVPGIYNGNTDTAVIRYKTSTNNTGSGWRLTFKGVYPSTLPSNSKK